MKTYYVTFRSVTPAQYAERIMQRAGVACALQRTPRWMENMGCGYCLRIPESQEDRMKNLLREGQISYRRIFRKSEDGRLEEMTL